MEKEFKAYSACKVLPEMWPTADRGSLGHVGKAVEGVSGVSRSKGYKCYNVYCGMCIGGTLCAAPGDNALLCRNRVVIGYPKRICLDDWKCGICEVPTKWIEWKNAGYMFCPYCGRPLTLYAVAELEKKLNGGNHGKD